MYVPVSVHDAEVSEHANLQGGMHDGVELIKLKTFLLVLKGGLHCIQHVRNKQLEPLYTMNYVT